MKMSLPQTKANILTCTRCPLSEAVTPVPVHADVHEPAYLVLGEAPGRVEDHTGIPFTGPAGQLLRATLRRVGLDPADGAYLNVVSCWPKGTPDGYSQQMCRMHLKSQLDAFDATSVLVCGGTAVKALLPHVVQLRHVRGVVIPHPGLLKNLYPVHHPSYIYRDMSSELVGWKVSLQRFAGLVRGEDFGPPSSCIYCDKVTADKHMYTCSAHHTWFMQDLNWAGTKLPPHQDTLL